MSQKEGGREREWGGRGGERERDGYILRGPQELPY